MDIKDIDKKDTINLVIKQDSVEDDSISLGELFGVFRKGKKLIALFTVAAFIISLLAVFVYTTKFISNTGTVRALISFTYSGIEDGLDPHGKVLDIYKIRSPIVLNKVMTNLSLYDRSLTTEDLRRNIEVTGIIPQGVIDKILIINKMAEKDVSKLEQLETLEYHPTEFMVRFNVDKSLGFSSNEAKQVLNEILKEYRLYFFETYGDKDVLSSAVGELDYEDYDYPEVARVMRGQIGIMQSYINDKLKKSPDFRAKSTQMSFGDIISYLSILEDVDISRMNSLIFSYNLTKDKDRLLSLYEYRIEQYNVDMAKKLDESRIAQDAVEKYEKDKSLVLFGAGSEQQGGAFEFDQGSEYYDQLIERALDNGVSATNFAHEIDYYKKIIEKLNNDVVSSMVKQTYMKEVNSLIVEISDKLKKWVDIANRTVDEYYETEVFRDAIKIPVPADFESAMQGNMKKLLMIVAGVTFAGFALGVLSVFMKSAVSGISKKTAVG